MLHHLEKRAMQLNYTHRWTQELCSSNFSTNKFIYKRFNQSVKTNIKKNYFLFTIKKMPDELIKNNDIFIFGVLFNNINKALFIFTI